MKFAELPKKEIANTIIDWADGDMVIACDMLRMAIPKVESDWYKNKLKEILEDLIPLEKKFLEWANATGYSFLSNLVIKPIIRS